MSRTVRLLTAAIGAIALVGLVAGLAAIGQSPADVDLTGAWQLDVEDPFAAGEGVEPLPDDLRSRPQGDSTLIVRPDGGATIPAGVLERVGLEHVPGRTVEGSVEPTGRGVALELVDQGELLRVPLELEDDDHLVIEGLRLTRR